MTKCTLSLQNAHFGFSIISLYLPFAVGSYESLFRTTEGLTQMRDIHLLTKETLYRLVELHSFFDVGDLLRNCTRIEVKDKELAHHLLYELLEEGYSLRFLLEDFLEILLDILLRLLPKVNTGSIAICLHFL